MTPEQLAEAQRALASAIEAQTGAHAELAAARDALETLKRQLLDEELAALKAIPAETPIVLLPVRLETRYQASPDGTDLLIRIYPDDIHVDTHEPELTEEEAQWGRSYWEEAWRGGAEDGRERSDVDGVHVFGGDLGG